MNLLTIEQRNSVLINMARLVNDQKNAIIEANSKDLLGYTGNDLAMADRLNVDDAKIQAMVAALHDLAQLNDPIGVERYSFTHENNLQISNRTAPFGTVLIIYESRPDVTIEAAGIAFKSGNHILLKGGKEAMHSNTLLVALWHQALRQHNIGVNFIRLLLLTREETRTYLENPPEKIDLIVPRGGETLINFVKKHASCPVIVSGRGNNFVYVDTEADLQMAINIIINAKTTKISACNALDKVLICADLPRKHFFLQHLVHELKKANVAIFVEPVFMGLEGTLPIENEHIWHEEFLDYKIVVGQVDGIFSAIDKINKYSGGHSASIITASAAKAETFMQNVDSAAVYHNASTRFTDGFQFGLGGELAISTDKLHQRGPIGLQHLVTNKWYIHGNGQIR